MSGEEYLNKNDWYHDFSYFGINNKQQGGIFPINQQCKQSILFDLIDKAIDRIKKDSITGVELFCADGFYSIYSSYKYGSKMYGIDINNNDIQHAKVISKLLNLEDKTNFEVKNVFDLQGNYDFCICAGGLYHISNPSTLLANLRNNINTYLIIQTVYNYTNNDPNHFITPAPHWTWGCRFSYDYLKKMVEDSGWTIIEDYKNELLANENPLDRGSAYILAKKGE